MRRRFLLASYIVVVLSLLASAATPAESATAQPRDLQAPTYINAEVARVDADANTITLKSESGKTVLHVEGEARGSLAGLRQNDKVILAYRVVDDGAGGSRRIVTHIRPASPGSGEPGLAPAKAVASAPVRSVAPATVPLAVPGPSEIRTVENARIVFVEPAANRITIRDSLGRTHVLVVQEHIRQDLGVLTPGDVVTVGVQGSPERVVQLDRGQVGLPPAELAAIQEGALRAFELTAAQLEVQANAIDGMWLGYQEACLTEPPATNRSRGWFQLLDGTLPEPDQDGCRQQFQEIIRRGERLRDELKLAEDNARKAEVLPGMLREILVRHRLDF
jgi:hypothetical protein